MKKCEVSSVNHKTENAKYEPGSTRYPVKPSVDSIKAKTTGLFGPPGPLVRSK